MLKRAGISVAIVGVLLTGIIPAGDACAITTTSHHECCSDAEPKADRGSSCCSSAEESTNTTALGDEVGCDCVHPQKTPITTVHSLGFNPDDPTPLDPVLDTTAEMSPTSMTTRSFERRVRSHPPPPAYLLNCINLN